MLKRFAPRDTRGLGRRLQRLGRGVLVVAAVTLITFIVVEVTARAVDPVGISYYPETANYLDTLIVEEPIGYRNRPGLRGTFWGEPVSINSLGMRGPEVEHRPDADEFRIVMLGDSVVFGVGVPDDATIPQMLEQQLNNDLGQEAPENSMTFRVFNMGVPSYNSEQELIALETVGLALAPDVVTLYFVANDLQPKMWVLDRRASWLVDWVQRSYAGSLLAVLYWEFRSWFTGYDDRAPYGRNLGDHPRWPDVIDAITRIDTLCKERSIPFVLFAEDFYPQLQALATKRGIGLVNLKELRDADPRWAGSPSDFVVSPINHHLNSMGTAMEAALIKASLQRMGLLPRTEERPSPGEVGSNGLRNGG